MIERYNSDLANILGNLVNRTISMAKKYFDGIVPSIGTEEELDVDLKNVVKESIYATSNAMESLKVAEAIDHVFEIFRRSNKYIDETCPWTLAKEGNTERLKTVIYNLLESIRIGAVLLHSFLPETSEKIYSQLNTDKIDFDSIKEFGGLESGKELNNPEPLFARIDKDKFLEELQK